MNASISHRDLEALSAYLDGELNPAQTSKLEARLSSNQELRAALEELRYTRAALRLAPTLRAPRSFALTPQMAGVSSRPGGLAAAMRLVSVAATFLFVVTVAGDLLANNLTRLGAMSAAEAEMPAMESLAFDSEDNVVEEQAERADKTAEELSLATAAAEMQMEEMQEEESAMAAEAPQEDTEESADEAAPPSQAEGLGAGEAEFDPSGDNLPGGGGGGGEGLGGGDFGPAPEALPTWTPQPTASATLSSPLEGQPAADSLESARMSEPEPAQETGISSLRILEGSLAVIAVLSFALAVTLKKKRNN